MDVEIHALCREPKQNQLPVRGIEVSLQALIHSHILGLPPYQKGRVLS